MERVNWKRNGIKKRKGKEKGKEKRRCAVGIFNYFRLWGCSVEAGWQSSRRNHLGDNMLCCCRVRNTVIIQCFNAVPWLGSSNGMQPVKVRTQNSLWLLGTGLTWSNVTWNENRACMRVRFYVRHILTFKVLGILCFTNVHCRHISGHGSCDSQQTTRPSRALLRVVVCYCMIIVVCK